MVLMPWIKYNKSKQHKLHAKTTYVIRNNLSRYKTINRDNKCSKAGMKTWNEITK